MAFDSATSPLLRRRSSIAAGHSASVSESSTDSRHDNPFHYTTGKRRLRRRKIRKQLLAALTLILLVALAGLFFRPRRSDEWASAVPYATIFSNTEPQGLPEGHRVVWATQTNATEEAMFPAPYEKYRFNFLHGVVRSNEETYKNPDFPTSHYVHILSLIDHIPLEDIPFIMWQTYQASNLEDVIQEVSCVFSFGGTHSVTKAIRQAHRTYPYPQVQMASLIYCPISEDFQTMLDQKAEQAAVHNSFDSSSFFSRAPEPMYIHLTLQFSLHNTPHTLIHDIKLFPNIIANQPPKNSMAMCIAPLFDPNENSVDLSLQWREHHRMLGVNTV